MKTIDLVFEYPFARLQTEGFPLRGRWNSDFFGNNNPIVLELGCGKGEYTVGLARQFSDKNFIGIDIKGARMYTGATAARNEGLPNVAFLRTSIELLESFFAPGEVDEIWITFPDPQMKKVRKRLTGTRFIELYRKVSKPGGRINLKTDSPFLYTYTRMMAQHNGLDLLDDTADLYATISPDNPILNIRTHYERQWLARGLTIKYLRFPLGDNPLSEPEGADEIDFDTYRSYSRGYIQDPDAPFNSQNSQL